MNRSGTTGRGLDSDVRVLVTGAATWTAQTSVTTALEVLAATYGLPHLVVVHGGAPTGVDAIAATWCRTHEVRQEPHTLGGAHGDRTAGARRDARMLAGVVGVLAFVRAGDPGGTRCADLAEARGLPVRRRLDPLPATPAAGGHGHGHLEVPA